MSDNDFQTKLDQANRAKMQGIKLSPASGDRSRPTDAPKNRIEDALSGAASAYAPAVQPVVSAIPSIRPKAESAPAAEQKGKFTSKQGAYGSFLKKFFFGLIGLAFLGAAVVGGKIVYTSFRSPKSVTSEDTIAAVGKLVELPAGETPTVATVTDLAPLAGQEFFKDAAVGDKVLIFGTSKKAILYRPSTGKIIQVAPLGADAAQATPAGGRSPLSQ